MLHTYKLRVQNSCGVVLVFLFWREIVFGVTYILSVQYSCAVIIIIIIIIINHYHKGLSASGLLPTAGFIGLAEPC